MKLTVASSSSQRPFMHIYVTGGQRTSAGEIVHSRNGEPIHVTQQRLDLWAELFTEQFSWSRVNMVSPSATTRNPCEVSLDLPTEVKVELKPQLLKIRRATDPNEHPQFFSDSMEVA